MTGKALEKCIMVFMCGLLMRSCIVESVYANGVGGNSKYSAYVGTDYVACQNEYALNTLFTGRLHCGHTSLPGTN